MRNLGKDLEGEMNRYHKNTEEGQIVLQALTHVILQTSLSLFSVLQMRGNRHSIEGLPDDKQLISSRTGMS